MILSDNITVMDPMIERILTMWSARSKEELHVLCKEFAGYCKDNFHKLNPKNKCVRHKSYIKVHNDRVLTGAEVAIRGHQVSDKLFVVHPFIQVHWSLSQGAEIYLSMDEWGSSVRNNEDTRLFFTTYMRSPTISMTNFITQ